MQNNKIKILRKIPKEESEIKKQNIKEQHIKIENKIFGKTKEVEKNFKKFGLEENNIFITCQAGLEAIVKKDNEKLGLKNFITKDRIVRATATEKQIYEALIWNRFSNRVYLELANQKSTTFDELFEIVEQIEWKKILPPGIAIVTEATTVKSTLSHTPSIQSITKKAIVKNLTDGTGTHHLYEDRKGKEAHIQVFIIENIAYILLDITGNALHKRGYRLETGDAPIKETLSASLIALSGWKYKENFYDPFCGSGTFAIEAAMMAKNIAPGLERNFAIENFEIFNKKIFDEVKQESRNKIFKNNDYKIFASDVNEKMIKIARDNAVRAQVGDIIVFEVANFFEKKFENPTTIVTNPPYGIRLENENDEDFYKKFLKNFANENISGGFITSYEKIFDLTDKKNYKDRKLYNGGLEARFYKKIKNEQL